MNSVHARELVAALAACDPASSYDGPRALIAAVAEADATVEWEAAVRAGDPAALRLSLRACGDARPAAAAGARVLGTKAWAFDARWDAKSGRWADVATSPRRTSARAFSAKSFPEPVGPALAAFSALAPVAAVRTERGRPGWTLVLARPLPWPLFLRCDLSAPFAPRAAQLSLILRDARIVALDFDGAALWARFVG